MKALVGIFAALLILSACATSAPFATDDQIAAVSYRDRSGPTLTLMTVVNNRTGSGGHTALMINASQRVIFDPAGSFYHANTPERNDVLYGVTPAMFQGYISAHARSTYHVVIQTIDVTPAQAETALRLAQQAGPVPGAYCANATAALLRQVPGFESVRSTFYPVALSESFATIPGVAERKYYEDDDPDLDKALAAAQPG